jgi:tRNA dimethylallyltransferase
MPHDLITILGPTASGKTRLACHLAATFDGEIISADSRQIYKGMDIGTGKDLDEFIVGNSPIKHHLIDIVPPGYKYNIEEYQRDFGLALDAVKANGKFPILCGGSGLYLETALIGGSFLGISSRPERVQELEKWSDESLEKRYLACNALIRENLNAITKQRKIRAIEIDDFLSQNTRWKPATPADNNSLIIGIDIDRDMRRKKISDRLSYRMNHGLIEEVETLLANGLSHESLEYYGLEYRWVSFYLRGEITKRELFNGLSIAIHQFAKKQMTWFRRMEKRGFEIHWLPATNEIDVNINRIIELLNKELKKGPKSPF